MTIRLETAPMARLRPAYDVDRLAAEVVELSRRRWAAQRPYGTDGDLAAVEIDWRILPLRSLGGDAERTDPGGPGLADFADTAHLAAAPHLAHVLASVPAPLRSARLMALGPGVRVHEHTDACYGLRYGCIRLHVPIVTNPGAVVVIDGHERHWDAGRLWFGDFGRPHSVRNDGDHPRVHLVIDALVTPALLDLFPADHLDALPAADVVFARQPVPLRPFELNGFRCAFGLPAPFTDWTGTVEPSAPDHPARVDIADDRLVLVVDDRPAYGLVHVGAGEFRLLGWTDERCLHLGPDTVRCTIRDGRTEQHWHRPASPS